MGGSRYVAGLVGVRWVPSTDGGGDPYRASFGRGVVPPACPPRELAASGGLFVERRACEVALGREVVDHTRHREFARRRLAHDVGDRELALSPTLRALELTHHELREAAMLGEVFQQNPARIFRKHYCEL